MSDNINTDATTTSQEQDQAPQAQAQRPVTIEDVRAALGDTDPHSTNSAALRKIIGRGGGGNIQKHLEAIRAERLVQTLEVAGPAPDMPKELMTSVWQHIWSAAQARTAGALAKAQQQNQLLTAALEVAKADAASALDDVDAIRIQLDTKSLECEKIESKFEETFDNLAKEFDDFKLTSEKQLEATKVEAQKKDADRLKEVGDLKHQIDLIQRDREIEKKTLQSTIDKLVEQLTEYKSLLMNLKPN